MAGSSTSGGGSGQQDPMKMMQMMMGGGGMGMGMPSMPSPTKPPPGMPQPPDMPGGGLKPRPKPGQMQPSGSGAPELDMDEMAIAQIARELTYGSPRGSDTPSPAPSPRAQPARIEYGSPQGSSMPRQEGPIPPPYDPGNKKTQTKDNKFKQALNDAQLYMNAAQSAQGAMDRFRGPSISTAEARLPRVTPVPGLSPSIGRAQAGGGGNMDLKTLLALLSRGR